MTNRIKNTGRFVLTLIFAILAGRAADASVPEWNVISSNYQFSATFTCLVSVDGTEITGEDDVLAAFVGDECRGVAKAAYSSDYGQSFFFLTVFSGDYSGEEISFKIYHAADDSVYDMLKTYVFGSDQNYGNASDPVLLSNSENTVVSVKSPEPIGIWPVPAYDYITVKAIKNMDKISVFDLVGNRIDIFNANGREIKIPVAALTNGIYFIRIQCGNVSYTSRFIKK